MELVAQQARQLAQERCVNSLLHRREWQYILTALDERETLQEQLRLCNIDQANTEAERNDYRKRWLELGDINTELQEQHRRSVPGRRQASEGGTA